MTEDKMAELRAYCGCCGSIERSSFRPATSADDKPFEDLCCDECHYVIATLDGHPHAATASLQAENERLRAAQAWQPIETAPESCRGERPNYVLFYNGHHVGVGFLYPAEDDDRSYVYVDESDEFILPLPTHWMPLPAPPTGG